jgi:hypothetical protein
MHPGRPRHKPTFPSALRHPPAPALGRLIPDPPLSSRAGVRGAVASPRIPASAQRFHREFTRSAHGCRPVVPRNAQGCHPESPRNAQGCHPERSEGSRRLDALEIPRLRLGMTRSDRLGMTRSDRLGMTRNDRLAMTKGGRLGMTGGAWLALTRRGGLGMARRSRLEVTVPHPESPRSAQRCRPECAGSAHRCHPERSEGSRRLDALEIPRLRLGMTRSDRLGTTRGDLLGMTRIDRLGTTGSDRLGMTRSRRPGRNGSGRLAMAGGGRVGVMSTGLPRMTRAGGHSAVANRVASAHAAGRGRPQPPRTAAHGFRRTGA